MKTKTLVLLGFVLMVMSGMGLAREHSSGVLYVDQFYQSAKQIRNTHVIQVETEWSYSCGPTSLLIIQAHFQKQEVGTFPAYLDSTEQAIEELGEIYDWIGVPDNRVTHLDSLRDFAKFEWEWGNAWRPYESNGWETNIGFLKDALKDDIPGIVPLKASYTPWNPTGAEHLVIVFAYEQDKNRFLFFEPYYGKFGQFGATVAEVKAAVNLAGFAFFAAAP